MVEHDQDAILTADHVVDMGPGQASTADLLLRREHRRQFKRMADSLTGKYLSGELAIAVPQARTQPKSDRGLKSKALPAII